MAFFDAQTEYTDEVETPQAQRVQGTPIDLASDGLGPRAMNALSSASATDIGKSQKDVKAQLADPIGRRDAPPSTSP
jgi:hypothetical protein